MIAYRIEKINNNMNQAGFSYGFSYKKLDIRLVFRHDGKSFESSLKDNKERNIHFHNNSISDII